MAVPLPLTLLLAAAWAAWACPRWNAWPCCQVWKSASLRQRV